MTELTKEALEASLTDEAFDKEFVPWLLSDNARNLGRGATNCPVASWLSSKFGSYPTIVVLPPIAYANEGTSLYIQADLSSKFANYVREFDERATVAYMPETVLKVARDIVTPA